MHVPAIVSDRIYIPFSKSIIDVIHYTQQKFTYTNPDYINLKRLNKWTGSTSPTVATWEISEHPKFGECISFPRGGIERLIKAFNEFKSPLVFSDQRLSLRPVSGWENDVVLRPDQERLACTMFNQETCLIRSPTGSGKCLHPDTPVMMYDHTVRLAGDVAVGDLLLGPNLNPRLVENTAWGTGPLYRVIPHDGDPWICNKDHILVLTDVRSIIPKPIISSVREYLTLSAAEKEHIALLRVDPSRSRLLEPDQDNRITRHLVRWYETARRILFTVEYVGIGDYYGWSLKSTRQKTLDPSKVGWTHMFLLADGTVTHNTEVGLKVAEWILRKAGPVLIIVWETGLMDQWVERAAKRFGVTPQMIGRVGGTTAKRLAPITIGMQQTIYKNIDKYAFEFGGVIADEVQKFAASTFNNTINQFPARYRIGISASETRKDKKEYLIYDAFGPVMDEIDRESLILQEKIMDVTIRIVPTSFDFYVKYDDTDIPWADLDSELKTDNYNSMLLALTLDEDRNDLVCSFILAAAMANQCIIAVSRRREHAKYIDSRIRAAGFASGMMLGGAKDKAEFAATIDHVKAGRLNICVGTLQKSGVGHDVGMWNRGFITTPLGSNKELFEQMIGRLRRMHPGKKDAACYYFWDKLMFPHDANRIAKNYPDSTYIFTDNEWVQM